MFSGLRYAVSLLRQTRDISTGIAEEELRHAEALNRELDYWFDAALTARQTAWRAIERMGQYAAENERLKTLLEQNS